MNTKNKVVKKSYKLQKYKTLDGKIFSAASSSEVIQKMRKVSFNPCQTFKAFIENTAKNCKQYSNAEIRTASNDHFVEDLLAAKFLEII